MPPPTEKEIRDLDGQLWVKKLNEAQDFKRRFEEETGVPCPESQSQLLGLAAQLDMPNSLYDPNVDPDDVYEWVLGALKKRRREATEAKSKATAKPRKRVIQKRAKREKPTLEMTRAYEAHQADLSYRAIGKKLGKSPETIRQWVALAAEWYGDNARSKRVRQGLPPNTPDPKARTPDDDALAS